MIAKVDIFFFFEYYLGKKLKFFKSTLIFRGIGIERISANVAQTNLIKDNFKSLRFNPLNEKRFSLNRTL